MSDTLQNYSDTLREQTRGLTKGLTRKQQIKEKSQEAFRGIAEPLAIDKGEDIVKKAVERSKKQVKGVVDDVGKKVKGKIKSVASDLENQVRGKIAGVGKEVRATKIRAKGQVKRAVKQATDDSDDLKAKISKLIPSEDSMKVFNQKPQSIGIGGADERPLASLSDERIFPWDKPDEGFLSKIKAKVKSLYQGTPIEDQPSGGSLLAQLGETDIDKVGANIGAGAVKKIATEGETVIAKKVEKKAVGKALKQGGKDFLEGEAEGVGEGGFLDPLVDIASLGLGIGGIVKSIFKKPEEPDVQHINSSFQVGL